MWCNSGKIMNFYLLNNTLIIDLRLCSSISEIELQSLNNFILRNECNINKCYIDLLEPVKDFDKLISLLNIYNIEGI